MEIKVTGTEIWAALRDHVDLGEEAIELLKELDRERDRRSLKAWNPLVKSCSTRKELAGSFDYREFNRKVAKYVRSNHVTANTHWKSGLVEPNELKGAN